jgi:hypothetical protein
MQQISEHEIADITRDELQIEAALQGEEDCDAKPRKFDTQEG